MSDSPSLVRPAGTSAQWSQSDTARVASLYPTDEILSAYLNEAMALLGEGVDPERIERAAVAQGMPIGPLALLDAISLDLADHALHAELEQLAGGEGGHHQHDHSHDHSHDHAHVHGPGCGHDHSHDHGHSHQHAHAHAHSHGHDPAPSAPVATVAIHRSRKVAQRVKSRKIPESAVYVIEKMAHGFHRSGRAAGAGFYDYDPDGSQTLWSGLSVFKRGRSEPLSDETITQRLMLVQSLAALRLAGTGVAAPTELDRKAREGWGYPAALVGPIAQAEQVGRGAFDHACRGLAARFGDRFEPPSAQSAT